jgi:hypothetical protein
VALARAVKWCIEVQSALAFSPHRQANGSHQRGPGNPGFTSFQRRRCTTTQTDGCCASEAANGHATGYYYDQDTYDQHQGGRVDRVGRVKQCGCMAKLLQTRPRRAGLPLHGRQSGVSSRHGNSTEGSCCGWQRGRLHAHSTKKWCGGWLRHS